MPNTLTLGAASSLFAGVDLADAMRHIAWAGYEGVELSAMPGGHLHLDQWHDSKDAIVSAAAQNGLQLTAIDVGPLDDLRVMQALEAAAALGVGVVNVHPGGKGSNPAERLECVERLYKLVNVASQYGVTLCVKACRGSAIDSTGSLLEAAESIALQCFGLDFDPGEVHRLGEVPREALKKMVHRVRHVHIRDYPGTVPEEPLEQTCGRGVLDLAGVCRVLHSSGYGGPVNVSIDGAHSYSLGQCASIAAENRGYLSAVFSALGGTVVRRA